MVLGLGADSDSLHTTIGVEDSERQGTNMDLQQVADPIREISMAVRSELHRIGEEHSCIFASAVLTEVLHRKGYNEAYPLTVRALI